MITVFAQFELKLDYFFSNPKTTKKLKQKIITNLVDRTPKKGLI